MDRVHISFSTVIVECPYCAHEFNDSDDKIVNACNRNKKGYTWRICKKCAARVGLCYNYMGHLVAFKLRDP